MNSQPSPPWSLQPGEPPGDYLLFTAWLRLPAPRAFRKAAATLGCSVHRLRWLAARHHWKIRAEAIDQQRADVASAALNQVLHDEASDWPERVRLFREQRWRLNAQIMEAAEKAARDLAEHPRSARLGEIARMVDVWSRLGRQAAGLPLDPASAAPVPPSDAPRWDDALHKIYGQDADGRPAPAVPNILRLPKNI